MDLGVSKTASFRGYAERSGQNYTKFSQSEWNGRLIITRYQSVSTTAPSSSFPPSSCQNHDTSAIYQFVGYLTPVPSRPPLCQYSRLAAKGFPDFSRPARTSAEPSITSNKLASPEKEPRNKTSAEKAFSGDKLSPARFKTRQLTECDNENVEQGNIQANASIRFKSDQDNGPPISSTNLVLCPPQRYFDVAPVQTIWNPTMSSVGPCQMDGSNPRSISSRVASESDISVLNLDPSTNIVAQQTRNLAHGTSDINVHCHSPTSGDLPPSLGLHAQPTTSRENAASNAIDTLNQPCQVETLESNIHVATMQKTESASFSSCRKRRKTKNPETDHSVPDLSLIQSYQSQPQMCLDDLSSGAISSSSISFTNENPLSYQCRRHDTFHQLASAASILRSSLVTTKHSRAEDLESQAVSSGNISLTNEYPLSLCPRRVDQIHPIAPAANITPPQCAVSPAPRSLSNNSVDIHLVKASEGRHPFAIRPQSAKQQEVIQYGYGYEVYGVEGCNGRLFDVDLPDQKTDADGLPSEILPRKQRLMVHHGMSLSPRDHLIIARRQALLADFEHTLDLFPDVELDSNE